MIVLCFILAYLAGSLPFGLWMVRWRKGVDIRAAGSHHITTTNTIRQAGWGWGILVFIGDVSKGFLPVFLARRVGLPDWAVALTAALAVAGHCWPIFAQFRGGMGLATSMGAFLAVSWLGLLIALAVGIFLVLVLHHAARGVFVAMFFVPPALWLLGQRGQPFWLALALCAVLALRFTVDLRRKYRELWLDREPPAASEG